MNRRFILIYRIILFILAFLGVYLEITKYGVGMLMYYTVLSNHLVLIFTGYLVYLMMRPGDAWKAPKILRIKRKSRKNFASSRFNNHSYWS